MNIHQLSVAYQHEQDRILVRINSAQAHEIRLWLTRRLCMGWTPVLRATLDQVNATAPNEASPAWARDFQKFQDLKEADFSTPFKSDATSWPLGSEPLLVTTVRIAPGTDGGLELRFEESLAATHPQERSFQAVLAPKLMHGFMHLLEQALEASQWEAAEGVHAMHATTVESDDHSSHDRPKYLH